MTLAEMESYSSIKREASELKRRLIETEDTLKEVSSCGGDDELKRDFEKIKAIYLSKIKAAIELQEKIEAFIGNVKNPQEREFIRLRTLDGLTYEKVAERLSLSLKTVYRIRKRIIENLNMILP